MGASVNSVRPAGAVVKSFVGVTMFLYVQPSLFECEGPPPIIGEVVVALVDGQWSVGGSVRSLTTLEPLAMTALPGQQECEGRTTAGLFLAELLDVLEELHRGAPV